MGSIRSKQIKNISRKLIEDNPELFTNNFELNKHLLDDMIETYNNMMRNKIAGYIVRLINNRDKNYEAVRKDYSKPPRKIDKRKENQNEHINIYGGGFSLSYLTRGSTITIGILHRYGSGEAQVQGGYSVQRVKTSSLMGYMGSSYSF